MKVPNKIKNLTELRDWFIKTKPKLIELTKQSKLRDIREFNKGEFEWKSYREIPIKLI
jgi:hypothetical protein